MTSFTLWQLYIR